MPSPPVLHGQPIAATGKLSPVQLTFAAGVASPAETKAELLKQKLGYDPRESVTLRSTLRETRSGGAGLASDIDAQLARINASPHVKQTLTADDVYVHQIEAGSNRFVADRHCFLGVSTLRNVADAAEAGFSLMTKHATGGFLSGAGENPYGCTFAGTLEAKGTLSRVLIQFYMLRDFTPNGKVAAGTDDIHKGLMGGTFRDVSLGLTATGKERIVCDVCERDLYDNDCRHIPGYTVSMSPEEIAKQTARGVPGGRASYTMEDWSACEVSIVFDGAIPGAGTAYAKATATPAVVPAAATSTPVTEPPAGDLAAQTPVAAKPLEEPTMKYSKELKLSIGLAESATDEDVEARLAKLKGAETENAGFKKTAEDEKVRADAAETETFKAKYAGKVADDVIADLAALPSAQREALAAKLAATTKESAVVPPIDGLANSSLAAAAAAKTAALAADWSEADERWRQGLGVVDSREEVFRLLSYTPMAAFNKLFGTRLGETPYSLAAVKSRFTAFEIKQAPSMTPAAAK